MDSKEIITALSGIPIGAIIAWITVITGILGAISVFTVKMYKVFDKYREIKDADEALKNAVAKNSNDIAKTNEKMDSQNSVIIKQLSDIKEKLESQDQLKIKELRHTIISVGEEALAKKQISIRAWRSLQEMFDDYENKYKQNSYVKSLMMRVERDVEVVGQLDEHGYDIEDD